MLCFFKGRLEEKKKKKVCMDEMQSHLQQQAERKWLQYVIAQAMYAYIKKKKWEEESAPSCFTAL